MKIKIKNDFNGLMWTYYFVIIMINTCHQVDMSVIIYYVSNIRADVFA